MKDKNHRQEQAAESKAYRSKKIYTRAILILLVTLFSISITKAQKIEVGERIIAGEHITYEAYFKWGLIMSKAGVANVTLSKLNEKGSSGYKYSLLFNTAGIVEKFYKMRDTLDCWISPNLVLQRAQKRILENNYAMIDDLTFSYSGKTTSAHSLRYNKTRTKIDTLLVAEEGYMFDMFSASLYLRSIDWNNLDINAVFPFKVAIGRDVINVNFRYNGQQIVERNGNKYKTRHFYVDIYDDAFTQSKEAAEIWVSDDENHILIKIRAKLKIGAAEVYYKESSGLRYPLDCEVSTKK